MAVKSRVTTLRKRSILYPPAIVLLVVLACAVLYAVLPHTQREKASNAVVQGVLLGGVYSLLALGVVVVYKSTKVFNLSFGGLLLFLTYFMYWLLTSAGLPAKTFRNQRHCRARPAPQSTLPTVSHITNSRG